MTTKSLDTSARYSCLNFFRTQYLTGAIICDEEVQPSRCKCNNSLYLLTCSKGEEQSFNVSNTPLSWRRRVILTADTTSYIHSYLTIRRVDASVNVILYTTQSTNAQSYINHTLIQNFLYERNPVRCE